MAHENISKGMTIWAPVINFGTVPGAPELTRLLRAPGRGKIVELWGNAGTIAASGTCTLDCEIVSTTILSTSPTLTTAGTAASADIQNGYINTAANSFTGGQVIKLQAKCNTLKTADDVIVGIVAYITGP